MLPVPFRREGSTLPVHLPPHFELFYRENLRRVIGARIRSTALLGAYTDWAGPLGHPSMTFSQLRRHMGLIGHRHLQSNGVHYADVALAADVPHVPDNLQLPASTGAPEDGGELVGKVDAALASLLELRAALVAARDARRPHEAAQRVLGLFDQ